jgi:PAS domain S-box-containing protein
MNVTMDTTPKDVWENNFKSGNGNAVNVKGHLESVLKIVSEICRTPLSLVNIKVGTEQETFAAYGEWNEGEIALAKSISRKLGGEHDFLVINDIREHEEIVSKLSKEELETVKFFASVSLKDELGVTLESMWVFDSEPRTFSESQKEYFKSLADETEFRLQNYNQKELIIEKNRMIEKQSIFLKNSSDITFILQPETGKIIDVNNDIDQVLGYYPDSLLDTNFIDLVISDKDSDTSVKKWFTSEIDKNGRYSITVQLKDKQHEKRWFQCNFTSVDENWYVTAKDVSEIKEAESGVNELKEKFKKVVGVVSDLIYELDWDSRSLSWGDELTDILGYPNDDQFVDYDWWLDKVHPDDLERITREISMTVEGESDKVKLIYRIKTYDGSYKYVLNHTYVDRKEDGSPDKIIGAIVDISDLNELKESNEDMSRSLIDKETLLKEVHHRIKNNLAIVSGMMQLQAHKEKNEAVKERLFTSSSRINTMATIHEILYQSASFSNLELDANIRKLIDSITQAYDISIDLVAEYDLEPIELNINQAIPFSLIINEVVTNVLKHAFDDGEAGILSVKLFGTDGKVTLTLADNGKGLPDDFDPARERDSLGLELIDALASQLDAEYSYKSLDKGAQFTLTFEREESSLL